MVTSIRRVDSRSELKHIDEESLSPSDRENLDSFFDAYLHNNSRRGLLAQTT